MASYYAYEIEIEIFKNQLRNYELYKSRLEELNKKIEALETKMYGVKSTSLIKMGGGTTNPDTKIDNKYNNLDRYDKLIAERNDLLEQIKYIEKILENIPSYLDKDKKSINIYKKAMIDIYAKRERYEDVIRKYDIAYSPNGLSKCIERMIIKVFQ